jgi:8-amino-3,8-dideoxy-alpha-D-manno-octulosonate transaminase
MEDILTVCDGLGLPVVEDTAQACGGTLNGKSLGTFGKMGTFSFDSVKTLTTGEGGMLITDDEALYVRASEYHDHGHDHDPTVGRGLEKRRFFGFNYRMMELQGALGLAQLKKLDGTILARQRENKAKITGALTRIDGVTFRSLPDPKGDIASFLMFFLPTEEQARAFNRVLSEEGCPSVYWYENTWHYYEQWEHLLEGKTAYRSGFPFKTATGETRCAFLKDALPRTATWLSRCITIPINLFMDGPMPKILSTIDKAAKVL